MIWKAKRKYMHIILSSFCCQNSDIVTLGGSHRHLDRTELTGLFIADRVTALISFQL